MPCHSLASAPACQVIHRPHLDLGLFNIVHPGGKSCAGPQLQDVAFREQSLQLQHPGIAVVENDLIAFHPSASVPITLQLEPLLHLVLIFRMGSRAIRTVVSATSNDGLKPRPAASVGAMVLTIPAVTLVPTPEAEHHTPEGFDFLGGERG